MSAGLLPIPAYDGYLAGEDGHVYSTKRWRGVPLRRLTERPNQDGYPVVQLSRGPGGGGRSVVVAVHKLIAIAWLSPRPSRGHQVRHLDGNPINNRSDNLAWGTPRENAADRERHGRTARGERSGTVKLTEAEARSILTRVEAGETQVAIARDFGVCIATVSHVVTGRNWRWLRKAS